MREFSIQSRGAGKRLDRWLSQELPALPMGLMQKFIRLKRVKINGKAAQRDTRLAEGDVLQLYLNDEYFEKPRSIDPFLSKLHPRLSIVFENEHVLLVDKRPGLITHPDEHEKVNTLLTHARAYLYQKGEYDSMTPGAFAPALCNRIDRFTGGIVILAKTEQAMHILNRKIREREVEKRYLCIVHGRVNPPSGLLDNAILKQQGQKRVTVLDHDVPDAQRAQTRYRTLACRDGLSLMECELLTGRTHQIRAQFAHLRHPLLGDNQYGDPRLDKRYHRHYQALYAYRLDFRFTSDAGVLAPLNGRSWQVNDVAFVREYFPEFAADPLLSPSNPQ